MGEDMKVKKTWSEWWKLKWKQFRCPHKQLEPIYHSYRCGICNKIIYD